MGVNIKPSELPANTVIVELGHGMWIKDSNGWWTEVHPRNPEYSLTVSDKGFVKPKSGFWGSGFPDNPVEKPSDEFFGEFDILATPLGWRPPRVPKESQFVGWPIPGHPNYEIRSDGLKIRNIKHGKGKTKNMAKSGFFILYSGDEKTAWTLKDLGSEKQIKHFLKTGELLSSYASNTNFS